MLFKRFFSNRSGNVATLFAISLLPLAGASGLAIDYSRAATLKTEMQKAADATALTVVLAKAGSRSVNTQTTFTKVFQPGVNYSGLKVSGSWTVADKRYRVTASATTPTTMMSALVPSLNVETAATAELNLDGVEFDIEVVDMDPEAGDYNQLFVYCYKPPKDGTPGERKPVITDAQGTKVDYLKIAGNDAYDRAHPPELPAKVTCGVGETLSVKMLNIRDGNNTKTDRTKAAKYEYYTDATEEDGIVSFHTSPDKMVESIKCANKTECTTEKPTGKIPPQKRSRLPEVNTQACNDDYMYLGWEDRPPDGFASNQTASDEDYDDIRVIMRCKKTGRSDQMKARLVE